MSERERHQYVGELVGEVTSEVWSRLSGNGSLRVNIDTDVDCYGTWAPHSAQHWPAIDHVNEAQDWVEYFVRSTINHLIDKDLLNVPEES